MKCHRLLSFQDDKPYVPADTTSALRKQSSELAVLRIGYSSPTLTANFKHPATYGLSPEKEPAAVSCRTDASCIPKGALSS